MGAGTPGGSSSSTSETALSKAQAKLLTDREVQFQKFFFPEILAELKSTTGPTAVSRTGEQAVRGVNVAANAAQSQLQRGQAQRGLTGSGVAELANSRFASARSSALSDALFRAQQANTQRRGQILTAASGFAPTPTTAAPLSQQSRTSKGQKSYLWGAF